MALSELIIILWLSFYGDLVSFCGCRELTYSSRGCLRNVRISDSGVAVVVAGGIGRLTGDVRPGNHAGAREYVCGILLRAAAMAIDVGRPAATTVPVATSTPIISGSASATRSHILIATAFSIATSLSRTRIISRCPACIFPSTSLGLRSSLRNSEIHSI